MKSKVSLHHIALTFAVLTVLCMSYCNIASYAGWWPFPPKPALVLETRSAEELSRAKMAEEDPQAYLDLLKYELKRAQEELSHKAKLHQGALKATAAYPNVRTPSSDNGAFTPEEEVLRMMLMRAINELGAAEAAVEAKDKEVQEYKEKNKDRLKPYTVSE